VRTLSSLVSASIARQRFSMTLVALFAALALALASVGIFSVMSFLVTQRTHEIGIRMALGAQATDVLKMVLKQGMLLTCVGLGIGLIAAFALTRVMGGLLFNVRATDPLTFAGVSLLLMCVALIACYIPARRATRVDPMRALHYE
jgi:putative ABC transport system permease protein